jgi:hypothetical protein
VAGRIQKQDVKTEAEVIADGGLVTDLINDTQIYSSVISKTLDQAILDGDIGGGGGGVGGFTFSNLNSNGPSEGFVLDYVPVFLFSHTDEQEISAFVTVPDSYTAGTQILLQKVSGLSESSGDVLLECRSYLIKSNQNLSSLPTPHLSSSEESLTANLLKVWGSFQLTDLDGEIDSVAVSPGDFLLIKFNRKPSLETATLTNDFKFFKLSALPVFE